MMSKQFSGISLNDLDQVAIFLKDLSFSYKTFDFKGDLGAGKTTLIKILSQKLGVVDNVSSPTYAIENVYKTAENVEIHHYDFYRLNDCTEALDIGVEDVFYSNKICFIEWSSKISKLLPENCVTVSIHIEDSLNRSIEISIPKPN